MEIATRQTASQPGIGSPRYGLLVQISELRHWPVNGFPYLIFYIEKENRIELARVLHESVDIPSWLEEVE